MACTARQKLRILHSSNGVWRGMAGLPGAVFSELEQMIEDMKKILVLVLAVCSLAAAQARKLDRNAQTEEWQAAVMTAVGNSLPKAATTQAASQTQTSQPAVYQWR